VQLGCTIHREMKKKGRPSKNGAVEPQSFLRALMVIDAYSKARAEGEKHSTAVTESIEFVRQLAPEMRISETEAKRVLAEFLPRNGQVALKVNFSILEGEEAARRRSLIAQIPELAGTKTPAVSTDQDLRRPLMIFKFGFGKRPSYPRHNATSSNP
jgi:hypothetical protein